MYQPLILIFGCRTLAVFKGAGFVALQTLFLIFDFDPAHLHARRIPSGVKIRTLHKNGEECGTPALACIFQTQMVREGTTVSCPYKCNFDTMACLDRRFPCKNRTPIYCTRKRASV